MDRKTKEGQFSNQDLEGRGQIQIEESLRETPASVTVNKTETAHSPRESPQAIDLICRERPQVLRKRDQKAAVKIESAVPTPSTAGKTNTSTNKESENAMKRMIAFSNEKNSDFNRPLSMFDKIRRQRIDTLVEKQTRISTTPESVKRKSKSDKQKKLTRQ